MAFAVWVAGGCGGGSGRLPDAMSTEHDLTISLFKHVPFVDGDTESAPVVAVQDGDGAWIAAAGDHGVYHAHLTSDRHGIAIGCRAGDSSFIEVFQRTAADGLDFRERACPGDPIDLHVTVQNVPAGSFAYVSTAGQAISGGGDTTYTFHMQPGPTDLFASVIDSTGRVSSLVRMATFDLQASKAVTIDFGIQGLAVEDRGLVVTAPDGDAARVVTSVIRPSGAYAMSAGSIIGALPTYQIPPLLLRDPEDLFEVTVMSGSRSASITRKSPDTLALELPPDVTASAPMVLIAPVLHPRFSFVPTATALAMQSYAVQVRTSRAPDDASREWRANLSAAWIAGAASFQYLFPDLSSALTQALAGAGSPSDFQLFTGTPVRWAVTRVETSSAAAAEGRKTRIAWQAGAVEMYCGDGIIQPPEACDPPDGSTCSQDCTKRTGAR